MIDSTSIQLRDPVRDNLAAQMAAFEAEFGPVQTLPIFVGERPKQVFSIHTPGKPREVSKTIRRLDHERAAKNATRKKKNQDRVDTVRRLAGTGATIEEMAAAVKITKKSLMRLMRENNIVRGPKMNLEA